MNLIALILSGVLIGVPAQIIGVSHEFNGVRAHFDLGDRWIETSIQFPPDCPVDVFQPGEPIHLVQLKRQNGVFTGWAQECPI